MALHTIRGLQRSAFPLGESIATHCKHFLASLTPLAGHCGPEACSGFPSSSTLTVWPASPFLHGCACGQHRTFAAGPRRVPEKLDMTDAAVQRLHGLLDAAPDKSETALRLTVEAGGCSGFSYRFDLTPGPADDDMVFDYGGAKLVVDSVSYEFVRGATVDFVDELIKSTFEVVTNPNASGRCGCGSSFSPKDA